MAAPLSAGRSSVRPVPPAPGSGFRALLPEEQSRRCRLEPTSRVAGIDVAGIGDLLAMKLKVLDDGGELRDHFDLVVIDERSGRRDEEGIALFLEKYSPRGPDQAVSAVLRALAFLDDVEAGPLAR